MLTRKGTQTIITQRLTLRRFQVDDAQAMSSYENPNYYNWVMELEGNPRCQTSWCSNDTQESSHS